jgi:tail protein
MLYLFAGTENSKDRLPFTYNGLTLNDETVNRATTALYECNTASIDEQWDAVLEPLATTHGMEAYEPHKVALILRIDGVIRAPSLAVLMDAARALNWRFDPVNAYRMDSATTNKGYRALDFSIPTADTATYASGLIPARVYVRSLKQPVAMTSQFEGLTCQFSLYLQAADPRFYLQTEDTASRSNAGALVTDNTKATFASWPVFTLTFTGAGSGQVSIANGGTGGGTLIVDATGYVGTDIMLIDMQRRTVKKNGTLTMSDYVSGAWQEMQPTENVTWTIANVTGTLAATVLATWRRAFS